MRGISFLRIYNIVAPRLLVWGWGTPYGRVRVKHNVATPWLFCGAGADTAICGPLCRGGRAARTSAPTFFCGDRAVTAVCGRLCRGGRAARTAAPTLFYGASVVTAVCRRLCRGGRAARTAAPTFLSGQSAHFEIGIASPHPPIRLTSLAHSATTKTIENQSSPPAANRPAKTSK